MSPLPTSKRRLADQRPASLKKKAKTASPLERAFLVDDHVYRPPPSLRLLSAQGELATPRRRRVVILPRPASSNGRDPFQHLGDDEVFLIISLLPRKESETIRRVSKFWKATSEYHCGKGILLQNLPWAATQDLDDLPKEAVNLRYRRQREISLCLLIAAFLLTDPVYHYSTLQRGWATRAFTFDGVYDWHLNNHALVWANGHDKASIQELRDSKAISIDSEANDIRFEFDGKAPAISEIPYIQLTASGDIIVLHRTYVANDHETEDEYDPAQRRCPASRDKLFKLSEGRVQWQLALKGSICKPAIGAKALYFLEQYRGDSPPVFKKIDLTNGALLSKTHPPEINEAGLFVRDDQTYVLPPRAKPKTPTPGRKVEVAQLDTSLKLGGNETIAVWSDLHYRAHIFSTANGQILMTYDRNRPTITPVGAVKPQVWDISADADNYTIYQVRCTSYNPRTENVDYAFSSAGTPAQENSLRFFDTDRPVAFDLSHDVPFLTAGSRDPFTTIQIAGFEKSFNGQKVTLDHGGRLEGFEDTEVEQILVTLPAKPGQPEKRRPLEFDAPWFIGKDDFFGFVEGYLVYHNFTDKQLILVDFWPSW